jgi:hypothetical protein
VAAPVPGCDSLSLCVHVWKGSVIVSYWEHLPLEATTKQRQWRHDCGHVCARERERERECTENVGMRCIKESNKYDYQFIPHAVTKVMIILYMMMAVKS